MLLRVDIAHFAVDTSNNMPLIILKEHQGTRTLPISIGSQEAASIAVKALNLPSNRPLSIDLVISLLRLLGANLEKIIFYDLINQVFYVHIYLYVAHTIHVLECRPSDAVLLAMRCGSCIYVEEKVFDALGFKKNATQKRELRETIANLDTHQFGRYYFI